MSINRPRGGFVNADATAPALRYEPVIKADQSLPGGPCRGLLVGGAGTANLMDASGEIRANVPLQQGFNPLQAQQVRTGGTATDIWALY
ncbi:hypothetical protein BN948_01751 [Hydrogenophaga intermedia]|uniref:Uncharacterized protein n=1 Tax=Hydrogenophaga intermedia TaxID=65786 RepID=A0A1L1PRW0_HYDIT|nr:hypothetical protein [Hydrogenophaga intermedia]CDN87331.1 hypothetical protein BN948_01751 [Hydrogenophaga intermedia]